MLSLVLALSLAQAPASDTSTPVTPAPERGWADDAPRGSPSAHSARLFSEPRVGAGVLVGRMGMGLLLGGTAASLSTVVMVVLAYSGASAAVLVPGVILTAALTGLATALGAAMFGAHYGRDFVDTLVVSMITAAAGALLFLIGYLVPVLMAPMLVVAGVLMVVEVPLVVQALKQRDEAPSATVAALRF